MTDFETENRNPEALSSTLSLKLESQKGQVLLDIALLIQEDGIEDEVDKRLVGEAVEFVDNPTEDIEAVMKQTVAVAAVHAGYVMQGGEPPAAIDALYEYVYAFQCIAQIKFVEEALNQESSDSAEIKTAISQASQSAKILLSGWKDDTFLNAVNELQVKLDAL